MTYERLAPMPNGLLEVKLAAYPIATETALTLGLIELDPNLTRDSSGLWRAAEEDLLGTFTGLRVEHVTSVRDQEWFSLGMPKQPLTAWFRQMTKKYLECRGPSFVTREHVRNSDPLWIIRELPPDLLAASLWEGSNRPTHLNDSTPVTALNLKDEGFAETHLHIGAGLEFGSHWIGTLFTLLSPSADMDRFQSPGGVFSNGTQLPDWLLRAAITRQFLGEFLTLRRTGNTASFPEFLQKRWNFIASSLGIGVVQTLLAAIRDTVNGFLDNTYNRKTIRWAFQRYCQLTVSYSPSNKSPLELLDPLEAYFPYDKARGASTELQFAAAALIESEQSSLEDKDFNRAFWQSTRIRNIYYHNITQRALVPGLAWFVRHSDRIGAGRQSIAPRDLIRIAARVSGAGRGLRYFEFRTSPPERVDSGRQFIVSAFQELGRVSKLKEAGIVLHFIRQGGGGKAKGLPLAHGKDTYANPSHRKLNPRGYRYQGYAARLKQQAVTVAKLLALHPHLLLQIRAIDLCTDEMAIPIWAFVGTFRALRTVGERISTYLSQFGRNVPPLRRTVHAGEDYPHLLTGLRTIGETVFRLQLQPGDRLGHALALGVDPERWLQTTGVPVISVEKRLQDLTWEWNIRTGPRGIGLEGKRSGYLERQIRELSLRMFGDEYSPLQMSELINHLHNPEMLAGIGFPNGPRPSKPDDRESLVIQYLTDPNVFLAGSAPVEADVADEPAVIEEVQTWLRGEVARQGLAVEINPTSNFLIGNLGEWKRHPLFRMNSPDRDGVNPVPLVIGSDDPLVFATGLPEEYSALERAMSEAGIPKTIASQWLEEARNAGVKFRFTLPGSTSSIQPVPADNQLLAEIRQLFS